MEKSNESANNFFNDFMKNISQGINVCKIGKVNKFNPKNMTVDVTPLPTEDNAMILNVPVLTVKTRDYLVYYPLEVGDNVILLFSDNDIDNIMLGQDNVQTERNHDISDCVCLGGFSLFNDTLEVSNPSSLVIKNNANTCEIELNSAGVINVTATNINLTGMATYKGREIAVKGDSVSDGAVIV